MHVLSLRRTNCTTLCLLDEKSSIRNDKMIYEFGISSTTNRGDLLKLTLVKGFFGRVYDLPPSKTVAREDGRHRAGSGACRPLIFVTVRALAGGGRCTVVEEIDRGPLAAWHSVPISRTVASLTEDLCA